MLSGTAKKCLIFGETRFDMVKDESGPRASDIIRSILERSGHPNLLAILTEKLSGTELNSVLLEVFRQRTNSVTAPELLNSYQKNRFVKPSDLPVLDMKRMELEVLHVLSEFNFQPLDLSPVSVLGSCSVVGHADQKKILSALRGTEVLADSTNAIALHFCDLKESGLLSNGVTRFCNIQRQVRTQVMEIKGFTPHFRIGCLVSCGHDTGSYHFEKTALADHIKVMQSLFIDYYKMDEISFRLLRRAGYPDDFLEETGNYLALKNPESTITLIANPEKDIRYYKGIQYKVDIRYEGRVYEIGDGGFVDWTQQLLQNKKERMLSTGFGFDLMHRILHRQI